MNARYTRSYVGAYGKLMKPCGAPATIYRFLLELDFRAETDREDARRFEVTERPREVVEETVDRAAPRRTAEDAPCESVAFAPPVRNRERLGLSSPSCSSSHAWRLADILWTRTTSVVSAKGPVIATFLMSLSVTPSSASSSVCPTCLRFSGFGPRRA